MNKRFVINLYFGAERLWCWFWAERMQEADTEAEAWAECFCPGPDMITVYECPELTDL